MTTSAARADLASPCEMSAIEVRAEVERGHLSPMDVVDAAIARIEATDAAINALPVRCFERARRDARAMMDAKVATGAWPPLAGLTLAVKDNTDVAGVPTSGGSAITAGRVPSLSDPVIARLENQGAIVIAKSNLSELGGANTTNALFGPTRNPHAPHLTAGGSSGGSAAALALGQAHLGHGNDVGGSLRTPAAFCGVAGLRPTPGLVPRKPMTDPFDTIFVEGPMARTVAELALMLDAMSGFHAPDLMSHGEASGFLVAARQAVTPPRLAVSEDLGLLPVEPEIRAAFRDAVSRAAANGCDIEEDAPPLSGLPEAIKALRGLGYLATWRQHWPRERHRFTAEVEGDIAFGEALTADRIAEALSRRALAYRQMIGFFERHDLLLCPTVQVAPFAVEQRWPTAIGGQPCESYVDWIMITYVWSVLGCPAASVPLGIGSDGLPVSIQVVGPPHSDARVISLAAWLEARCGVTASLPLS